MLTGMGSRSACCVGVAQHLARNNSDKVTGVGLGTQDSFEGLKSSQQHRPPMLCPMAQWTLNQEQVT